jgi:hypothetical protein
MLVPHFVLSFLYSSGSNHSIVEDFIEHLCGNRPQAVGTMKDKLQKFYNQLTNENCNVTLEVDFFLLFLI